MQPGENSSRPPIKHTICLPDGRPRRYLALFSTGPCEEHGSAASKDLQGSEERKDLFLDLASILLGCLSFGHSFIGIRAGLADLLLALSRAVRVSWVGMIVVAWTVRVLMLVATTIRRLGSAGIGLAVRIGGRR